MLLVVMDIFFPLAPHKKRTKYIEINKKEEVLGSQCTSSSFPSHDFAAKLQPEPIQNWLAACTPTSQVLRQRIVDDVRIRPCTSLPEGA
jgi:hypothetical protein